jgi:hypothetical protein
LDFGDCNIGHRVSQTVTLTNLSPVGIMLSLSSFLPPFVIFFFLPFSPQLTANVEIRYSSKCIFVKKLQIQNSASTDSLDSSSPNSLTLPSRASSFSTNGNVFFPVSVPARGSAFLQFDLIPRKVNPDYRKQITFRNLNNPGHEMILELFANNVDEVIRSFPCSFVVISLLHLVSLLAPSPVSLYFLQVVARNHTSQLVITTVQFQ